MLTVACVLKSGGIYDGEWVNILQASVARNLSYQHRFACLTDMDVDCDRIDLENDWPGWWSKVELFRPDLFTGPVVYLDLDTVVIGDLDDLLPGMGMTAMREPSKAGGICSTAMAWHGDLSGVYRRMIADPEAMMQLYDKVRPNGRIGDQAFILDALIKMGRAPKVWRDKRVASYKHHCQKVIPRETAAIAFHGKPKPCDLVDSVEWVANHWRA